LALGFVLKVVLGILIVLKGKAAAGGNSEQQINAHDT